jgi:UDP-N-acetylglucosamine 1-carboxyvinyltransferase
MAAVLAEGETTIDNAAREPEITDLAQFLVAMGAHIEGIGSSTLSIVGVERDALRPADHVVVSDRVEAVTFMSAVGSVGGDVILETARPDHLEVVSAKLSSMGLHIETVENGVRVAHDGQRLRSLDLATLPYPGVATDYKPFLVTLLSIADGVGIVSENLYADRFRYLGELVRMGANVRHEGNHTVVRGVPGLQGARVKAHDIRAGAALIVAGIGAEGTTTVENAEHIVRGYERLDERLRAVGVEISYDE